VLLSKNTMANNPTSDGIKLPVTLVSRARPLLNPPPPVIARKTVLATGGDRRAQEEVQSGRPVPQTVITGSGVTQITKTIGHIYESAATPSQPSRPLVSSTDTGQREADLPKSDGYHQIENGFRNQALTNGASADDLNAFCEGINKQISEI
jgi:hypothetical protein